MRSFFRAVFLGLVEFAAPRLAVGFGMPLDQWIADFAAWALSSPEIITRDQAIWGTMTIVGVLLSMLELWLAPAGRIFARMKLRGKAPPTASLAKSGQDSVSIDIDLTPSSGQRSDVRLSVKNNGALGTFSAQCQILAARNDPNQLKTGVFNLPWLCLESGGNWFWRLSERVEFCGGQATRSRVSSAIS